MKGRHQGLGLVPVAEDKRTARNDEADKSLFATAVRLLGEHHDLRRKWPLSYTLPNGRSIEAVCDRVADLDGEIPANLLRMLHNLAVALSVAEPAGKRYGEYAPVLREIAARLALPIDQRRPQHRRPP
jgi:hypothetical protein